MATAQVLPVDTWPSFASYLLRRYDRFVSEQTEAWGVVCELADSLLETQEPPGALASARTLPEAAVRFERAGRRLLLAPYDRCARLRPIAQSLNAIEDLDRDVTSYAGAAEYIEGTRRATLRRAPLDGMMQLLLSRLCLRLGKSWSSYLAREVGLEKRPDLGQPGPSGGTRAGMDLERRQAAETLGRYRQWTEDTLIDLTLHRHRGRVRETLVKRHERHLEFWRGRQRPVAGILDLETGIWKTGLESLRATDAVVRELEREGKDLRRRVQGLIRYLDQWTAEPFDPPAMDARIAGPEERIESWQSRMSRVLEQKLPQRVGVPRPRSALSSLLERNGQTQPRRMYSRALRYEVLPVVDEQFRSRILFHLEIAATLVRAEQVVRYALDTSRETSANLVPEALQNAISLLRQCDESPSWDWSESEACIVRALFVCSSEVFSMVRSGQMGDAALIARRVRLTFTPTGRRSTMRQAQSLLHPAAEALARRSDEILVNIGWNEPERALPSPVMIRSEIRAPSLAGGVTERSALYDRLFELTPVEDPRFLVGREAEIDGFRQAFEDWHSGRFTACVMVGANGSGKSSVLSCAIPQISGEIQVSRCEIDQRLSSPQDLERSIRALLKIPAHADLVEGIRANRQVIVLERLERAFLKTVGGFEAMRALIEIIHATASSAFWVVVLDVRSFELLDAALNFGDFFSHRVNALRVRSEIIERAILQRHYLSGLKLSFPEVHRQAWQEALGWSHDPQKWFFAALHRQSGGNFRSALKLWLSSIENPADGVIQLKELVARDYRAFRDELAQADQFALLSVEQHGSLTVSELAAVLCEPEQASRLRIDRLTRMGLLEQDSECAEFRIRQEAHHMVEELLHSVNLV
jgi:hypothetical protein